MDPVKRTEVPPEKTIPIEERIRQQRDHIAELRRDGRPTDFAERFLKLLIEVPRGR